MTQPATISADYTLRPSELAATLALLVEARQPAMVWGPPGSAKSMIAQQVAADGGREYVDVRALLLDPVDLRGIPWRDAADRTRWAPPVFLPPTDDTGLWLINLEELPSCVPMVQAALYQLALERKVGEYELPEGASLIACGSVLRTTACGSVRADRHSIAVTAPLRRVPRRRFPHRSYRRFGLPDRPGRPWVPHPTHPWCLERDLSGAFQSHVFRFCNNQLGRIRPSAALSRVGRVLSP